MPLPRVYDGFSASYGKRTLQMIPAELNETLTIVDQGSAAGELLRQYWQPAAISDEIKVGLPVPVNLLGEKLFLDRDISGDLRLFHREFSDNEPPNFYPKTIKKALKSRSYPTIEKNGVIFAFLGDGKPITLQNFDCFRAPSSHSFAFKGLWECNWLQALEIGIDPAHASFLHRFLKDEEQKSSYGKQFRGQTEGADIPMTKILRDYPRPEIKVNETEYGLKITALRHMDMGMTHVRVTNCIFPNAICIPMSREMTITQWHVPIDNHHCYWYTIFTSFDNPVDKQVMRAQRLSQHNLPDYSPIKNKANNYQYDPEEQRHTTFTGMGLDINVHDQWAVEMMGSVQDRTREHLGRSDIAIVRYRRMLRKAMASQNSGRLDQMPMQPNIAGDIVGPLSNDAIAPTELWEENSHRADLARRKNCPWDASI